MGEYVSADGKRCAIQGVFGDKRWVCWADGTQVVYGVEELRESDWLKPYVAPVLVERWVNVWSNYMTSASWESWAEAKEYSANCIGHLKLTFENGKLVKAEVQNEDEP